MNNQPIVSIAIPTYNRIPFLRESLASIKTQTFKDYHVYLFDDGSTEPVEEEARKIIPDIIFIRSEKNEGAHVSIDRALHYKYTSPFFVVFHDDDTMHPRMIEEQVKLLNRFSDAAFVGTNLTFADDENRMFEFDPTADESIEYEQYPSNIELTRAFLRSIHLGFSSVMYRTEYMTDDVQLQLKHFGPNEDRPFLVALASSHPSIFIKNKLLNYRMHPAQDSKTNRLVGSLDIAPTLMSFYRAQLPVPLSHADRALFLKQSTNALLDSFCRHASKRESLSAYIKAATVKGLFSWTSINHAGLRALWRRLWQKK